MHNLVEDGCAFMLFRREGIISELKSGEGRALQLNIYTFHPTQNALSKQG